jgi:hypothetical protein
MANTLFLADLNNPSNFPSLPSDNSDINWSSQSVNPGLYPIISFLFNNFTKLYNEMDATIIGKGIQFENLANGAVRPENQRELIGTAYNNRYVVIDSPVSPGNYFIQNDGATLQKYIILPPFQLVTNFRNFQAGVDNVTTELDFEIVPFLMQNGGGLSGQQTPRNALNWFASESVPNAGDWGQVKLITEVAPDSSFTTGVQQVSKKSVFFDQKNWSHKAIDKTSKTYQNPWYRQYLTLEKNPDQGVGSAMQLIGELNASAHYKCKNKHI